MQAAAHLATIPLLVGLEPVIAAQTSSDASISQWLRVIPITSTPRRNRSFGMPTAVAAVPTVVSLAHGPAQMAAPPGPTWKALKVVRYAIARIPPVIIRKTGTTRGSQ